MLEFLAVLAAGFAVLLVLAAVRLSLGPISLDFATPYIEAGLSRDDGSRRVEIERTALQWGGWDRTLDVHLSGVRVVGGDGGEQAYVPDLAASFSVRALLTERRLAPTRLDLFGPRVRVVRRADGALSLGEIRPSTVPEEAPAPDPGAPAPPERARLGEGLTAEVLARLAGPPDRKGPLGYLGAVSLLNADFVFEDQHEALVLRAPGSDIVLARGEQGLGISARLNLLAAGSRARIDVAGGYSAAADALELEVTLDAFTPAAIAPVAPVFRPLAGLRIPVSGRVLVRASVDGAVSDLALDLSAGPGALDLPDLFEAPVALRSAQLKARASDDLTRLVLEAATADLDGPRLALSGQGSRAAGRLRLALDVGARNVATADVKRLWPRNAALGGRAWVMENVERGGVSDLRARLELAATQDEGGLGGLAVEKLEGGFDFAGLAIHFLKPLPPVTGVGGRATFTPDAIVFEAKTGRLGALAVTEGKFRVHDLDTDTERMAIETVAAGPIAEAVRLLAHPRLDLVKGLGIEAGKIKGTAATRIRLAFPLRKDLEFDHMEVAAASTIRGAAVPGAAMGNDLTDGNLTLQLDKRGMDVGGTARVAGVPVTLDWTENFQEKPLFRSRYHVRGTADEEARAKFGLGFLADYAKGPAAADVIVTRYDADRTAVSAVVDLKDAALAFPEIGWEKAPGVAGTVRLTVDLEKEEVRAVRNLVLRAGDLSAAGRVTFDADAVMNFELPELRYGDNDLRVSGRYSEARGLALLVTGRRADIRHYLRQKDDGKEGLPLDLTVDLAEVRAAPATVIASVEGRLVRDALDWQNVEVNGTVGKDRRLRVSIARDEQNRRKLRIQSDDAGEALKAFDITDNMVGGTLNIEGFYNDGLPGRPLEGHFAVRDFRMVKAPFLAKLLSVASLTGLFDALSGQGIAFARGDAPFVKTGDILALTDARAHGAALGFTAEGRIDLDKDALDLRGTVVPAYALNSVFADIPILGGILVPEKGSGLFAATYAMRGPIDNPEVSVNPLATLAPGFLRGLFNIFDARERPKDAPPAKEAPAKEAPAPAPAPAEQGKGAAPGG